MRAITVTGQTIADINTGKPIPLVLFKDDHTDEWHTHDVDGHGEHRFRYPMTSAQVALVECNELRAAAQEWADLCHDFDLNERGQAVMGRLRRALSNG